MPRHSHTAIVLGVTALAARKIGLVWDRVSLSLAGQDHVKLAKLFRMTAFRRASGGRGKAIGVANSAMQVNCAG
jgi:hypothetical protein